MKTVNTTIRIFKADTSIPLALPYADEGIRAGFPSPAQDYINESIDLNRDLIDHPVATFYGRVTGDSMIEEGIETDDLLVIDRALEPENGDLAVCCLDGEFTLKRINIRPNGDIFLMPSNPAYRPIPVTEGHELVIWGVVTYIIKAKRRLRHR